MVWARMHLFKCGAHPAVVCPLLTLYLPLSVNKRLINSIFKPMRDAFHDELDAITQSLVDMAMLVKKATADATTALLTADLSLAEKVIAQDDVIDSMQHELDAKTMKLLATQQPVASDLRVLVTSLRMSADLERMGDMAHHISKLARMRHPGTAVPSEASLTIEEMGRVAGLIIEKTAKIIASRNLDDAKQLAIDDDEMDKLHRKLIQSLITKDWPHGAESAIDLTLLGRYYERSADHAVSISRRVHFLVTGKYLEDKP